MRYSKQRDEIFKYVTNSCEHPTADKVYKDIRKKMPTISLGTVYRNLNSLVTIGKIKKITVANSSDHYDKTLENHYHILCTKCGNVYDVDMKSSKDLEILNDLKNSINSENCFIIENMDIMFYGICNKCLPIERV